jgi:hypothetical protein
MDGARAVITLEREQSLRVARGARVEIACRSGVLWITQERDVRDLFVAHGERLTIAPRGVALVTALEHAQVDVTDVRAPWAVGRATLAMLLRLTRILRAFTPRRRLCASKSPAVLSGGLTVRR